MRRGSIVAHSRDQWPFTSDQAEWIKWDGVLEINKMRLNNKLVSSIYPSREKVRYVVVCVSPLAAREDGTEMNIFRIS